MLESLVNRLMKWCERRGKVFKITGTAGPEDVYLIRYYVIKSKFLNVFIHQFLRSDRDDLHDHPWNFCTYLVKGSYTENKFNPETGEIEKTRRVNRKVPYSYMTKTYKDFSGKEVVIPYNQRYTLTKSNVFVTRKATDLHQVVVDKDLKEYEKDQAALTLFVSGPSFREWGFVKAGKWIDWKSYLGLPSDTPSRG